jgi:hypothetical protein
MPSVSRSSVRTAVDAACFATSTGWRTVSLSTDTTNRIRSVTAPRYGIIENGSRNALSSMNCRFPSGVYGYFASDSNG